MRLTTSLLFRYFALLATISIVFTCIFNIIELCEKLLRTDASLGTIFTFIGLNTLPSWLMLLPLSSWLAMLAFILLMQNSNEWQALTILGIRPLKVLLPFALSLSSFALLLLGAKHFMLDEQQHRLTCFHKKVFKHHDVSLVKDRWFLLPRMRYAHISSFDPLSKKGTGLSLYTYTTNCTLVSADRYDTWHLANATFYSQDKSRELPALSYALTTALPPASWWRLLKMWRQIPHTYVLQKAALRTSLLAHLTPPLEVVLLPLMTLVAYLLLTKLALSSFACALLAYPLWECMKWVACYLTA